MSEPLSTLDHVTVLCVTSSVAGPGPIHADVGHSSCRCVLVAVRSGGACVDGTANVLDPGSAAASACNVEQLNAYKYSACFKFDSTLVHAASVFECHAFSRHPDLKY